MDDVEETVQAQEEHDVRRDVLHVIKLRYHVQLRQNCEGLQPPRERLQDAIDRPLGMQDHCEHRRGQVEVVVREAIGLRVIALSKEGVTSLYGRLWRM